MALHFKSGRYHSWRNQFDVDCIADQGLSSPVLKNVCTELIFDFVPLACARRQVTNCDCQPGFVRQLLDLQFPQVCPKHIIVIPISGDQQPSRLCIGHTARRIPPVLDAFYREGLHVVIHIDANAAVIMAEVVHIIWSHLAEFRDEKVVFPHLLHIVLRALFASSVPELTHKSFLPGLH